MRQDWPRTEPPSGEPVAPPPGLIPARAVLEGRTVRLEPVDARIHAQELYEAAHGVPDGDRVWDYLGYGPFPDLDTFRSWLRERSASFDPIFYAIRDKQTGEASGMASFLSIVPGNGSIEIGHIWFGPALQNSTAATEALYLMIRHAFDDLGYRRMEWKCNAQNQGSRNAANRLGFRFEGMFYQHMIVKGRNRDTAWYSILDSEWPALRAAFDAWLAPENFDEQGRQREPLRTRAGD